MCCGGGWQPPLGKREVAFSCSCKDNWVLTGHQGHCPRPVGVTSRYLSVQNTWPPDTLC